MPKQFCNLKHQIAKKVEEVCKNTLNDNKTLLQGIGVKCIKDQYYYVDLINIKKKRLYEVKYLNPQYHERNTICYETNKLKRFFNNHEGHYGKNYRFKYLIFSNQTMYMYKIKAKTYKEFIDTHTIKDMKYKGECFEIKWQNLRKCNRQPQYNQELQKEIEKSFKRN